MNIDRTRGILAALDYLGLAPNPLPCIGRTITLPRRRGTRRLLSKVAALIITTARRILP